MVKLLTSIVMALLIVACSKPLSHSEASPEDKSLILGVEQTERYLPLLAGKRVGVVVNQTSMLQQQHLVDYLLSQNVKVHRIFAPEHGFRGIMMPVRTFQLV